MRLMRRTAARADHPGSPDATTSTPAVVAMTAWQYLAIAGFGAFHGLNPGMGWLVALAAGVHDRSRTALLRALVPIAAGHALAVFVAAFLVSLLRSVVRTQWVAIGGGIVLVGFGLWRAFARRHDHELGFRLSDGQLVTWSFLMASVHGAGLALLPILVATPVDAATLGGHVHGGLTGQAGASLWVGLTATLVHTLAMVGVTAVIALACFQVVGLRALGGGAWLKLEWVWTVALITSGVLTVVLTLAP